jgi:hypothetical protein
MNTGPYINESGPKWEPIKSDNGIPFIDKLEGPIVYATKPEDWRGNATDAFYDLWEEITDYGKELNRKVKGMENSTWLLKFRKTLFICTRVNKTLTIYVNKYDAEAL